jgi:Holliday junction resolvasome RuvABC endonuclease subunit
MKKNNRVLAIDPGTRYMGVAVLDGTKLAYYGVKTLSNRKLPHDILIEGRKTIRSLIEDFKPGTLAVEKTFFANNRNSALLNVFADEIVATGKRKGLRVKLLAANVVRKEICKNGWATKREVAQEVCHRFPELVPYLSSDRRWKEEFYLNMFDAVALGIAVSSTKDRSAKV